MTENVHHNQHPARPAGEDALIAGKSLVFYWRTIRFFFVLMLVLVVIDEIFNIFIYAEWIIEVAIFALLTIWLLRRFRVKLTTAIAASIFLGVLVGFTLALFDIAWYRQWWRLLNFIRMPFILAVVGAASSFVSYLLFQKLKKRDSKTSVKGGEVYGRKPKKSN